MSVLMDGAGLFMVIPLDDSKGFGEIVFGLVEGTGRVGLDVLPVEVFDLFEFNGVPDQLLIVVGMDDDLLRSGDVFGNNVGVGIHVLVDVVFHDVEQCLGVEHVVNDAENLVDLLAGGKGVPSRKVVDSLDDEHFYSPVVGG